jgi:glycosyltransferase involved in cell wall biosynthesis
MFLLAGRYIFLRGWVMRKTLEETPLITVVVISINADPLLLRAVASVAEQDEPAEIIVVNSNGGNAAKLVKDAGFEVKVIEIEELLFAGGARNRGIYEAKAPYVAFLASDCVAAPGWIRERLKLHVAGSKVVASAMMPASKFNLVSWADHLLLFPHRLPFLPSKKVILYGASFARDIFTTYGLFDPNLRTGEDSEFLQRLAIEHKPVWAPSVITMHRNKTNLLTLMLDQFKRGHRFGIEMRRIKKSEPRNLILFFLKHSMGAHRFVRDGLRGRDRFFAYLSLPFVTLGSLCKAAGILSMVHLVPKIDAGTESERKQNFTAKSVVQN